MFCKYCGAEVPNGSSFCPKCGKQISDMGEQARDTDRSDGRMNSDLSADSVMDIGGSSLVLAFTIVFSAGIVLSLIGYGFSFMNLLTLISEIIVCAGCWIVYAESSQKSVSSRGFSVLRIGVPIYLVIAVLGLIIAAAGTVRWTYGILLKMVAIIAYLAAIIISIWGYYGLCLTTNDAWKIANGETVKWRVTTPCLVILIILAVFNVFGVIAGIGFYGNAAALLANLAFAAVFIIAIVILFKIRGKEQ